jgi:polynucleotide 5'-triphosphatase
MPKSPLDCRISISLEMQYDGDMQELMNSQVEERSPDRNKDRLSYTQSVYQIDLTQVTQASTIKVSFVNFALSYICL